jgi:hypothetical protein
MKNCALTLSVTSFVCVCVCVCFCYYYFECQAYYMNIVDTLLESPFLHQTIEEKLVKNVVY